MPRKPKAPPTPQPVPEKEVETLWGYHCQECDHISEEYLDEPLYECGDCGEKFNKSQGKGNGHGCPECSKFGSKLADRCCIECEVGEVEEIAVFRCPCPNCDELHAIDE